MGLTTAIVVALIGFFAWQGFRCRCPKCGSMGLHPKDAAAKKRMKQHYENLQKTGLLKGLDKLELSLGSEMSKPGYANAPFKCKSCDWSFSRKEAMRWLTTANKLGEEVALREYEKLKEDKSVEELLDQQ